MDILLQYDFQKEVPRKNTIDFVHEVRLQKIHFKYPDKQSILENIDFNVKQREKRIGF